jgi:fermentation-respiration switch protein FrsA (DUF1100 family)
MLTRAAIFVALVVLVLYLAQPYLLFPAAMWSFSATLPPVPVGIHDKTIYAEDGTELDCWRKPPTGPPNGYTVLLFHGNGETLWNMQRLMADLSARGYEVLALDYRGYARSRGVPSYPGVYQDAEALWKEVTQVQGRTADRLIPMGISIGTGYAAYLASRYHTPAVVLFAPYVNIPEVVRETPLYSMLWRLVKFNIPVEQFVATLQDTLVIAAHGARDTIIRPRHSEQLEKAYRGSRGFVRILVEEAGHNDLLGYSWGSVLATLEQSLDPKGTHDKESPRQ